MHQVFIEGGVIRKLWSGETRAYRDHLLRLDAESRHNRFCGTIADGIIRCDEDRMTIGPEPIQ